MKREGSAEEQIIGLFEEREVGARVPELTAPRGQRAQDLPLEVKSCGMEVSDVERLREIEGEKGFDAGQGGAQGDFPGTVVTLRRKFAFQRWEHTAIPTGDGRRIEGLHGLRGGRGE